MDGFPSGQRGQTVNLLQIASVVRIHLHPFSFSGIFSKKRTYHIQHNIAGWSSLEARRAHNPKVASSNLAPATRRALLQRSENPVVVSFLFKNIVVVQRKDTYYNADREKELGSILMKEAILTAKIKHKKV